MSINPGEYLSDDFFFQRAIAITWFAIGSFSMLSILGLVVWKRKELKSVKFVVSLILASNFFFLCADSVLLYYRCNKNADGQLPDHGYNGMYAIFSGLYCLQKITYVLVSWTFAHRYWVISLTLLQALSGNEITFDERVSLIIYYAIAVFSVVSAIIDSTIYYLSLQMRDETLEKVSDVTFLCYGLVLIISLGFLMVAICRISRLLK